MTLIRKRRGSVFVQAITGAETHSKPAARVFETHEPCVDPVPASLRQPMQQPRSPIRQPIVVDLADDRPAKDRHAGQNQKCQRKQPAESPALFPQAPAPAVPFAAPLAHHPNRCQTRQKYHRVTRRVKLVERG